MDKLIIKCVICSTHYGDHHPDMRKCWHMTPEQTAEQAVKAQEAGAAVIHFHEPWKDGKAMGLAGWQLVPKLIREQGCDVVIEHGQGGSPYNVRIGRATLEEVRKNDLRIEHKNGTEMMVNSTAMIDHTLLGPDGLFADESLDRTVSSNSRRNMEINCRYYRECGVKPRMETYGFVAPIRNIEWLVARGALDKPYCLTWNFGMTGIAGDPATIQYLQQRIDSVPAHLKDDVNAEVSVYQPGAERLLLHTYAIANGLHIRLGMEDMPLYWTDVPAKDNVELVERVVRIAKEYHRPVADSSEARKMYNLPAKPPGL